MYVSRSKHMCKNFLLSYFIKIKSIIYNFQGFHVERRFGWDCHGLPVEFEIDKTLGIKGPEDVEKMGIDKYNAECRKIVMKYASEWETITTRVGRWIGIYFYINSQFLIH